MKTEKLQERLEFLNKKHIELDNDIKKCYNAYDTDEHVAELKLKKLHIKEEIEQISENLLNG